ncbi:Alpha-L-fucosidase [Streptomyces sp. 1222.5]|nr:alpha-L-fucosidase-like protein [Streptomyces sp. 5112.2]SED22021.1 Alpha-L-fucosidase [Streptomyces sp. 1222.5]
MQSWFRDVELGIFVHWGVSAVDGAPESWSSTASRRPATTPRAWADLFARAGARYAVLTARHHDGVALWDSAHGELDVARRSPAGRDLIAGYAEALRERGLRVGLYYSHSDRSHPDYASVRYARPGAEDPAAWARYLTRRDGQVGELVERYRPDLAGNPDTVLNARVLRHGDYATGTVPDRQRLLGSPAPGPPAHVGRAAGAPLHGDDRRGRQPRQPCRLLHRDRAVGARAHAEQQVGFRRAARDGVRARAAQPGAPGERAGTGAELGHEATGGLLEVPGVTWLDAPAADVDEYATGLAGELDGELDLYRGTGRT